MYIQELKPGLSLPKMLKGQCHQQAILNKVLNQTTEKNPGPSKPSEQLKYISRFLVQAIPLSKEKDKAAPKRISGG